MHRNQKKVMALADSSVFLPVNGVIPHRFRDTTVPIERILEQKI